MLELYLKIFGDVIGVNFRYYAKLKADDLGITGWVKNLSDGSVQIVAQGEKTNLEKFLKWARQGPNAARVDKVEIGWAKSEKKFAEFEIRY